jgi:putative ABC transport system permease protein
VRWLREVSMKLRAAFCRTKVDREMEAELSEHLEREAEDLISRGVPLAEARRQAATKMGRLVLVKEECRDARGVAGWEQLTQDIAFGVRLLLKKRTFSCIALATIAIGIGSTSAVFSLIDEILVRPLPFPSQDRLFYAVDVGMRGPFDVLRTNSRLADYAAYWGVRAFTTTRGDWPERVKGCAVSANFFTMLGVSPLVGHTFAEGDDRQGRLKKVVLSHDFWVQQFGARRDVIGQQLNLDEASWEIVGVMPPGFQYPTMTAANFWIPLMLDPHSIGQYWGEGGLMSIGRLRDSVTLDAAQAELRAWIPRIRTMFPWRMPDAWGTGARLEGLRDHLVAGAKVRSLLLLGVVALVLLIAIVNVANLLIGQTAARQRELALRASLGATPGRLTRQLLTESLVLAVTGGVLGTTLAFIQLAMLKRLLPADMPRLADVAIDERVLAFTATISLGSGLLFGLLPAWQSRGQRSLTVIDGCHATLSARGLRTDSALVVTEAAFATILLVGAGLLLHTFWTLLHVDPGFKAESVVTAELSLGREAAGSGEKTMAIYEQLRGKLSEYPGVMDVAATNVLPLTPEPFGFAVAIEDHPRPPQAPQFVLWSTAATPNHFSALGIRLLQGRGFSNGDRDGAPLVVLVSKSTAHRYWPDRSPLGRRLKPVWDKEWRTIVGVVDDVKNYSITGPPNWVDGEIYLPMAQGVAILKSISLIVRISGDPGAFEMGLPTKIKEVCPSCAVSKIVPMKTVVSNALQAPRSMAWLVGGFALLALGLAAAGIYGVVSHGVIRRTRELGVRLALGAGRGRVAWLVMGSSLRYTLIGTVAGLAASWALARWVRTLLYGVATHDPVTFSIAPVVLVTAAILASLFPMYRAIRIDPAESLREE